jgi:hypothetical protein
VMYHVAHPTEKAPEVHPFDADPTMRRILRPVLELSKQDARDRMNRILG